MSTSESPRSRSGFSSASLMSAGEAATSRANSPMAACSGSVDSSLAVSGPRLGSGHYFGGLGSAAAADLPSAGLCVAICRGPGLASRSPSTSTHLDDRGMHGEGSACGAVRVEESMRSTPSACEGISSVHSRIVQPGQPQTILRRNRFGEVSRAPVLLRSPPHRHPGRRMSARQC
jgi:hypothetical protein